MTAADIPSRKVLIFSLSTNRSSWSWKNREKLNAGRKMPRSEEHTSELQSLMRISYAVFCLKKKKKIHKNNSYKNMINKAIVRKIIKSDTATKSNIRREI